MRITDELRKYTCRLSDEAARKSEHGFSPIAMVLEGIADRIDAEHEADVSTACRLAAGLDDDALAKRGYIVLPLDADGVPIRIGDVMENIVCPPVHREVTGVGAECFYGWDEGNGRYSQFGANCYRHHHAPTVEDVLREFAEKIIDSQIPNVHPTYEEAIAEYAAKLRLAEEVDA